jgi:hypothetical protein
VIDPTFTLILTPDVTEEPLLNEITNKYKKVLPVNVLQGAVSFFKIVCQDFTQKSDEQG